MLYCMFMVHILDTDEFRHEEAKFEAHKKRGRLIALNSFIVEINIKL